MSKIRRATQYLIDTLKLKSNQAWHTRGFTREYNPNGVDVFSKDWDNLIILDACRFDMFDNYNSIAGTLGWVESRGSTTDEFMDGNVKDRDLSDTVYVTATPALRNDKGDAKFHATVHPWRECWDSEIGSVHPRDMTDATIKAAKEYPEKRIVSHYLQPHYPFIGPTGQREFDFSGYDEPEKESTPFWNTVGIEGVNNVDPETIKKAYIENLEIALDHVEELIGELQGRSVVTADHGEMLNDQASPIPHKLYGHPRGLYVDELLKVPWFEFSNGERRRITAGEDENSDEIGDSELIEKRLEDLGYKN